MAISWGGVKKYEGCVVSEMERNGYSDSDFYALVYDRHIACGACTGTGWDGAVKGPDETGFTVVTEQNQARWPYNAIGDSVPLDWYPGKDYMQHEAEGRWITTMNLMDGAYAWSRERQDAEKAMLSPEERKQTPYTVLHALGYHPGIRDRKIALALSDRTELAYSPTSGAYPGRGVPKPDGFQCAVCGGTGEVPHPEGGQFRWIEYGTTRFGGGGYCRIDATDEVKELYAAWVKENERKRQESYERVKRYEALTELARGKRIRVTRGRKVPIGTEGVVFWHGASAYGDRVGFNDDQGETFWTAATNVEVLAWDDDHEQWGIATQMVSTEPGDYSALRVTAHGWVTSPGYLYAGSVR